MQGRRSNTSPIIIGCVASTARSTIWNGPVATVLCKPGCRPRDGQALRLGQSRAQRCPINAGLSSIAGYRCHSLEQGESDGNAGFDQTHVTVLLIDVKIRIEDQFNSIRPSVRFGDRHSGFSSIRSLTTLSKEAGRGATVVNAESRAARTSSRLVFR